MKAQVNALEADLEVEVLTTERGSGQKRPFSKTMGERELVQHRRGRETEATGAA
jgi:hypothetical protein